MDINESATNESATNETGVTENGEALIKLESLTKVFYTDEIETHALAGVHFDISEGDYVSIAGPSGSGKSTLLSILGSANPARY